MLNQIYIHYINTLFVLESFIISCWLLKGKKIGIGIGQFARKKSVSESATKNHDRCITSFVHIKSVEFKITLNTIDFQCMDKKHWGIFYLLCSTEERKSYRFGMSKWWQMFHFDWTTH